MDEIPVGANVGLDSDTLIYYVEEHDRFLPVVEPLIEAIAKGQVIAHVSVVTLMEVLVRPLREQRNDLVERYMTILTSSDFLNLHVVDEAVSQRAAWIRAFYRLQTPDSIIAATAVQANCSHIVSNNAEDFQRIRELSVLPISAFAQ
jgi:predicted nucleic acid-binding protein